jgi:hypothetical protein
MPKGVYLRKPASPLSARFWAKVGRRAPGECWPWIGAKDKYGHIRGDGGETLGAHCASWIIHRGPIPEGQWVLHQCDNPVCVNPAHLFLGAAKENHTDMVKKGRHIFPPRCAGEENVCSKLNWNDVRNIRIEYAKGGISQEWLGKFYGIGQATISSIVLHKTWRHAPRWAQN